MVGKYLHFFLFLYDVYGCLSDIAFLKITYIGFYKRTSVVVDKETSLSLTPSLRRMSLRVVFLWKAISSQRKLPCCIQSDVICDCER